MGAVILPKPAARSLLVAPRLPEKPKAHTGNPFTTQGDLIMDCDGAINGRPCTWHAMGERSEVKKAYDEHRRMWHSEEIGVVLLNQPRQ